MDDLFIWSTDKRPHNFEDGCFEAKNINPNVSELRNLNGCLLVAFNQSQTCRPMTSKACCVHDNVPSQLLISLT